MPDITMCKGEGCPQKEQCKRYTSSPSENQSWFVVSPIEDGECKMYWGEQAQSQFDLLVQIMRGDEELGLYDDEESKT